MSLPAPYYRDDAVTIYCGDARELLPELDPVEVILTDPPYSPNGDTQESNSRAGISIALNLAARLLRENGTAFVFSTSSARGLDWARECMRPLALKRILPWVKRHTTSKVGGPWRWDSVLIGVYGRATWGSPRAAGYYESSSSSATAAVGDHPVALPDGIARWLTAPFPAGTTILDPFVGSGALIGKCREMRLKAIGIEIEERYCEIAARRCAQEVLELR